MRRQSISGKCMWLKKAMVNAIRYHTTGRAGMSILEKIVFIADYIEPNREQFEGLALFLSLKEDSS